ncbi:MAG: PH domain-containing protein [Phyllobacteriaceae bacterium]|nr:PH domain-containing protein [Phyllobacteriaceae bacterium]
MSETGGPEHDGEPVPGLPGRLPVGEHIVWQGRPEMGGVMVRVLRARWIAGYFAIAALWSVAVGINDGVAFGAILIQLGYLAVLAAIVFGLMALFARAVSRTSAYTITNRRVVMRIGVALSASFNLPFSQITGADYRARKDGTGEIALDLVPGHGLSSAVFWPHQRGKVWSRLRPEMICLNDVADVAATLALQLQAATARAAKAEPTSADERAVPAIRPASTLGGARGGVLHPAE